MGLGQWAMEKYEASRKEQGLLYALLCTNVEPYRRAREEQWKLDHPFVETVKPRYVYEDSSGKVEREIELGSFVEVPVSPQNPGFLDRVPIIGGKNIEIEVLYEGDIGIDSFEEETEQQRTFLRRCPIANPLFNSDTVVSKENGVYQFRTEYRSYEQETDWYIRRMEGNHLTYPTLEEVTRMMPQSILKKYRVPGEIPETIKQQKEKIMHSNTPLIDVDSLFRSIHLGLAVSLDHLIDYACAIVEHDPQKQDARFRALVQKPQISSRDFATYAALVLNAFGFATRLVRGEIYTRRPEFIEIKLGSSPHKHTWTEVYIPQQNEKGFWIPLDARMGCAIREYPRGIDDFYTVRCSLPRFRSETVKTAALKISYV